MIVLNVTPYEQNVLSAFDYLKKAYGKRNEVCIRFGVMLTQDNTFGTA